MIARAFSSMPGLASGIARQIREGEIKRYLIQPIDLIGFLLLNRIAHKIAYYAVAIAPFALVFFLCRHYFVSGWPSAPVLVAFVASLVMGFLIGFFLEAAIGMIGFWFLEVSSLLFVYMLFSFFLSGHMFPLTLLPDNIEPFVNFLPFKYLAYFPSAIFLGKIPEEDLPMEMAIEAAWLAFFIIICRARVLPRRKTIQRIWRLTGELMTAASKQTVHPNYWRVFATFARNSLVRDMTFRMNFFLQCVSSIGWTLMNVGFYLIIFQYTDTIGEGSGWDRDKFFLFIATTWFINSLVQAFFMPNAEEFSELIRTGGLDFALTQAD